MSPTTASAGSARHHVQGIRVYWEDTDAGGVVFYANYLRFFERARTEWLRRLGHGQQALADAEGLIFVVAHVELRYLAPARLDDWLEVTVELVELGRSRLVLAQKALRGGQTLCEGRVEIACVRRDDLRPQRLPSRILTSLQA